MHCLRRAESGEQAVDGDSFLQLGAYLNGSIDKDL
jgi:hypothetical protein